MKLNNIVKYANEIYQSKYFMIFMSILHGILTLSFLYRLISKKVEKEHKKSYIELIYGILMMVFANLYGPILIINNM